MFETEYSWQKFVKTYTKSYNIGSKNWIKINYDVSLPNANETIPEKVYGTK